MAKKSAKKKPVKKAPKKKSRPARQAKLAVMDTVELSGDASNPRKITPEAATGLSVSLDRFGDLSGIVFNQQTKELVCGHQRLDQIRDRWGDRPIEVLDIKREIGCIAIDEKHYFPVRIVDWSRAMQRAANVAANSHKIAGEFSENLDLYLKEIEDDLNSEYPELYADLLFAELIEEVNYISTVDAEEAEERKIGLPEKPVTKKGDMWTIGRHKLYCEDATNVNAVARLFEDDKAMLCFTSPPYAQQRQKQYGGIPEAEYVEWFFNVQSGIRTVLHPQGNFVLNIKPNMRDKQRSLYVFDLVVSMVREWEWLFVDEFCWLRVGIPKKVANSFKNGFEPCYWFVLDKDYIWHPTGCRRPSDDVPIAPGHVRRGVNLADVQGTGWSTIHEDKEKTGLAFPSNVIDIKDNPKAHGHPAAFPVKLPSYFLQCMTVTGDIVYEPFMGSGSTLIAAEQLGRTCYGVEIAPQYCDLTVQRWQELTGEKAKRKK